MTLMTPNINQQPTESRQKHAQTYLSTARKRIPRQVDKPLQQTTMGDDSLERSYEGCFLRL